MKADCERRVDLRPDTGCAPDIANLKYRRQFVLARGSVPGLDHWQVREFGGLSLYSHPDLEVSIVSDSTTTIVLIGYLFDAVDIQKGTAEILEGVMDGCGTFDDCIRKLKPFAGRYVCIYLDQNGSWLLQDALALREVYFCERYNLVVCGSQPNLVSEFSNPTLGKTEDREIVDFYEDHMPAVRLGTLWVGEPTLYDGIRHLLPNHCLDLNKRSTERYWPNAELKPLGFEEAVERACVFLEGMMKAVTHRRSVMMAVTAGTDSRTLLAASRSVRDKIYYFINKDPHLTDRSPDIVIPKRIFARINEPFHIHEIPSEVDPKFAEIFLDNTFSSSERILSTIQNVYYKDHPEKINILGVGEIGRSHFGEEPPDLNGYYLAYRLGYRKSGYATRQCAQWLDEVRPICREYGINVLTLLLWEQLLGSWGAVGNSESDIAIEEFDPFDSHAMYEILLSADAGGTQRAPGLIFHSMILRMWPELLDEPINPPGEKISDKARCLLQKIGLYPVLRSLQYRLYAWRNSDLVDSA